MFYRRTDVHGAILCTLPDFKLSLLFDLNLPHLFLSYKLEVFLDRFCLYRLDGLDNVIENAPRDIQKARTISSVIIGTLT